MAYSFHFPRGFSGRRVFVAKVPTSTNSRGAALRVHPVGAVLVAAVLWALPKPPTLQPQHQQLPETTLFTQERHSKAPSLALIVGGESLAQHREGCTSTAPLAPWLLGSGSIVSH